MAATLEAIRGGGGSVKVGAVGTISTLMTREIESSSSTFSPCTPGPRNGPLKPRKSMTEASSSSSTSTSTSTTTTTTGVTRNSSESLRKTKTHNLNTTKTTPKQRKQKAPFEEVGNNTGVQRISKRSPDLSGRTRSHKRSSHIPMIGSENIQLEKTPIRDKPMKKGSNFVDIVDINCGTQGGSLSTRLKKLNFSKLSQTFM